MFYYDYLDSAKDHARAYIDVETGIMVSGKSLLSETEQKSDRWIALNDSQYARFKALKLPERIRSLATDKKFRVGVFAK